MATVRQSRTPASLRHLAVAACPACGAAAPWRVTTLRDVPANSCLMLRSPEEARGFPRGDIALAFCDSCGFIANLDFDPGLTEYSERYEPTQGWSPTFQRFHQELAAAIAARVPLAGQRIIEVGCGQGEFLHLLCGMTGASGLGFDPCLDAARGDVVPARAGDVRLRGEFFDESTLRGLAAELLVCKMTLEHIPAPGRFAALCARLAQASPPGMRIFVQVPDSLRILRDVAFEDIYYEHCGYFTEASLRALFEREGFVVEAILPGYGDQYVGLLARYTGQAAPASPPPTELATLAARFEARHAAKVAAWQRCVMAGGSTVVWGSGSKGVTFLGMLGEAAARVTQVVDINPHRQGHFMVGTGHPIVGPQALVDLRPARVVLMNAVYREEVAAMLATLGLAPTLLALEAAPP